MINIGLTGWGDHDSLYRDLRSSKMKLQTYSNHFPVVEIDSSFYAIQPERNYKKWIEETPDHFRFVVKAYQGMTGHMRGDIPFTNVDEMFETFKQSIEILEKSGKLTTVLFQYPPWFDCQTKHVDMLLYTKEKMKGIPSAIEFRNETWFMPEYMQQTLSYLKHAKWMHTICDEPQTETGSIPIVLEATHSDVTLIRLHGRNVHGWLRGNRENWRAVRCLYRYSEEQLKDWAAHIENLQKHSKEIVVLFNNNSGGDAADNAKQLMRLLHLSYEAHSTLQMKLF
ncbi:DUF72 domain-containing protein [Ectobacillus polymachus]|uniref:DUF72 domain-containing protein n=1 Tax=Ectobacillus polymachus TaxID=1508806 RepID=UPI003A85167D